MIAKTEPEPVTYKDLSLWGKIAIGVWPILLGIIGATWWLSAGQARTQDKLDSIVPLVQKVADLEKAIPVVENLTVSLTKLGLAAEQASEAIAVDRQKWKTYETVIWPEWLQRIKLLEEGK